MGSFLAKQWSLQGYYHDLVVGYISRAGGQPVMINYPSELQKLPTRCPHCGSSANLVTEEMYSILDIEREKFRKHAEKVIAVRLANGEKEPYPGHKRRSDKASGDHWSRSSSQLLRIFKRSTVVPSDSGREIKENPFDYVVSTNDLVVCRCMGSKNIKYTPSQKDEDYIELVTIKGIRNENENDSSNTDEDYVSNDTKANNPSACKKDNKKENSYVD